MNFVTQAKTAIAIALSAVVSINCSQLASLTGSKSTPAGSTIAEQNPTSQPAAGNSVGASSDAIAPSSHFDPERIGCANAGGSGDKRSLKRAFESSRHSIRYFTNLHKVMCKAHKSGDTETLEMALGYRMTIMKELGFTAADLGDVKALVAKGFNDKIGYQFQASSIPKRKNSASGTAPTFFQAADILHSGKLWYALWIADSLGPNFGEHARTALVRSCLNTKGVTYAFCAEDGRTLDRDRYWKELEDPEVSSEWRIAAKYNFLDTQRMVAEREKELKAKADADPGFAQMYFAIPKQARVLSDELNKSHPSLVALAGEMERAYLSNSRRATDGCQAKVDREWSTVLKAFKAPKMPDRLLGTAATPAGYLATLAAYYCARGNDHAALAVALGGEIAEVSVRRGPRTLTAALLIEELGNIKFDQRGFKPRIERGTDSIPGFAKVSGHGPPLFVVKRVRKQSDKATIEFSDTEGDVLFCKKTRLTNRWKVNSRSEIERVVECADFGTRKVAVHHDPITVPAAHAAGIKRGHYAAVADGEKGGLGAVTQVWSKPAGGRLLRAYGVRR